MAMGNTVTYRWSTTGGPGLPDTIVCPEEENGTSSFNGGGYKSGTKFFLSDGYYVFSGWKYSIKFAGVTTEYDIIDNESVYEDLDIYGIWTWYTQTVDEIGDEALAASIIDKSITYIYDSTSTQIGDYAFYSCSNLTTVDFPNVTSIGIGAFQYCTELTTMNIQAASTLGYISLKGCSKLTAINAPNLINVRSNSIDGCNGLTELCFPNVEYVGSSAITNCANLTTIDFWKKISCSQGPFPYNPKLTAVILRSTDGVSSVRYDFGYVNTFESGLAYAYVPAALVDSYKEASVWKNYPDQIRALEDYTDDGTTTGTFIPPSS